MSKKEKVPSITFVVLVYNAESLIEETLSRLIESIKNAKWEEADILVVDDGSTDGTKSVVEGIAKGSDVNISIHAQKNLGRLQASINGTKKATGDLVSFIGGRVYMQSGSLRYLKSQIMKYPQRRVWNCHIEIPRHGNLQAQFWHIVTFVTWNRYMGKPRLTSYDIKDFDYYPKGTGGFVCPREILLKNYKNLDSIYTDPKYSSDDTTLIRNISKGERIYMSPSYAADYISRSSFTKFIRHTYDRGVFLLDSYMRPGTRLFLPIIAYFILTPLLLVSVVLYPMLLLLIPVVYVGIVLGLSFLRARMSDIIGFCIVLPVFALVYSIGLWKGLYIFLANMTSEKDS